MQIYAIRSIDFTFVPNSGNIDRAYKLYCTHGTVQCTHYIDVYIYMKSYNEKKKQITYLELTFSSERKIVYIYIGSLRL